jgi:hypothetical protein
MPTPIRRSVRTQPLPVPKVPSIPAPPLSPGPPTVIVDFLFDRGLLSIALINLAAQPASRVSVTFSPAFKGLGGTLDVSALRLFQQVEFLAPGKRIEAFIDTAEAYFRRREPTRIEALITHYGDDGQVRRHRIFHDLAIYQDLVQLVPPSAPSETAAQRQGTPTQPPR